MNGFRNSSRNTQVWRWQRAGKRAVSLEIRGLWMEAAEAWRRAACMAPGQTGRRLPGRGLNAAAGDAREGGNEKAAFITPEVRRLKGVCEICFLISGRAV